MANDAITRLVDAQRGIAHRIAQRDANQSKAADLGSDTDADGLVEFGCECNGADCEKAVSVPLYVYLRALEADQYLLQVGHHAFGSYRTILAMGLTRIEARA